MTIAEQIVSILVEKGTTDAFGIPGGVILPFLYALDKQAGIEPHLNYHEQAAAFAALGYAQASGKLGVAYATRGPGICNMVTAIAEAYQESLPVLFVTAHGNREHIDGVRFCNNQEIDIVESVKSFTKYSVNIDELDQVISIVRKACNTALFGRRGPVLIDVASKLWNMETKGDATTEKTEIKEKCNFPNLENRIKKAKRPVILIGDGLRNTVEKEELLKIADRIKIPVLSSRGSQDLLSGSQCYFGYIGSHGIRYSNFILSKADLIVAVGNRMAFPIKSESFAPVVQNAQIIRIDIDEGEFERHIPGEITYRADVRDLIKTTENKKIERTEWLNICRVLKHELKDEDCTEPVIKIADFIKKQTEDSVYVCDVGNNEFWFSRAYEKTGCTSKVLSSKAFGTLGSSIGKAIGAYYATKKNVVCVAGDQGFQFNIQELQYIANNHLPVKFLLINNVCSRMIADHEERIYSNHFLHVNNDTGYSVPNFKAISNAYMKEISLEKISVNPEIRLTPSLPKGRKIQDMEPSLDKEKYMKLNNL